MRRYPAFDPPEYLDWTPDPELIVSYRRRIEQDSRRRAAIESLARGDLLSLYRDLLRTRLHDIGLKRWVKTGVISKAWLGTGEEAVTVGTVGALDRELDVVCPMIRNAGALHMMGVPLADLFRGYLATPDSLSGGRDLHIGDLGRNVLQPISHMGTNAQVMAGVALSFSNREEPRVALTFIGDGATRTAAFHEGANLAAVLGLPVIFVVQDNQVALGTRRDQHGRGDPGELGAAYGIPTWTADGNHLLDTWAAARLAAEHCRSGAGPAMVVARTFRMGGHATHDEREARTTFDPTLFAHWGRRDPIGLYEAWLLDEGVTPDALETIEGEVTSEMDEAADEALASRNGPKTFNTPPNVDPNSFGWTSSLAIRPI
ncbi:thiamine pyrophosphate-dependent dehydrogenase E1 component subunit alpha [Gaopeijia maritima]|uniref:thiamine pyrophosphate-dependent dehydrogenase E1 component subunit alpha n=1 Tax=Gaopeijia maritima TaxID=3119007 RepID=UPI003243AABF